MPNLRMMLHDLDDYTGQVVRLADSALKEEFRDDEHLVVRATGGGGCVRGAGGSSVFVHFVDGDQGAVGCGQVLRLATPEEREAFEANVKPCSW